MKNVSLQVFYYDINNTFGKVVKMYIVYVPELFFIDILKHVSNIYF